ncbi:uncharacterized protein F5Z01DRAFT_699392 [Emericellopsis atlantica]|uniref:Integral membrane protein n=1 Tax=Emericellopsis atlantica TaxID=2614577 RepID=A0A9P7ZQ38_9HYPO|nr:uncharacterized protein F5Z01DRAFT_699392 [Emericellopsis atlantica]KAG9255635.1 integral membrane protein [Emericellopsis atlantica]
MGPYGMGFPADLPNNGWKLYLLSLIIIISSGLFVIIRLSLRYKASQIGWDDACVVLSLVMSMMVSVCMQLAVENGYGMHKSDLETDQLRVALRYFFLAQTPYKISVCLNKVAVVLFCMRIFISRAFQVAAYTIMGIVVAWSIGGVGATIWQCVPIAGAWDKSLDATCIDSNKFWVAYAVMNILTDLMVLLLPIPSIVRLQLKPRDKLLVIGIFTMGGFVTITSILRTTSVQNSLKNKEDITFNFIQRGMWTLLEMNFGIISTCLPTLKKPLSSIMLKVFGSRFGTYGTGLSNPQRLGGDGSGGTGMDLLRGRPNRRLSGGVGGILMKTDFVIKTNDRGRAGRTSDEVGFVANAQATHVK